MATGRPDGGWGWIIALSAFVSNFIVDGVKYSFGIMFMELLDTFRKTKSATSWILSIQIAMLMSIAPVAGALVNRFGCRRVSALGTLIAFAGFLASPFATSVYYMYATFGVVGGIGFGISNLPMGVSIARYFDKHLALASGISAMGSGVGMLLFGPLTKVLIDEYTWRGTLLVESALLLNGLLCAAVLRPVPTQRIERLVDGADSKLIANKTDEKEAKLPLTNADRHAPVALFKDVDSGKTTLNDTDTQTFSILKSKYSIADELNSDGALKECRYSEASVNEKGEFDKAQIRLVCSEGKSLDSDDPEKELAQPVGDESGEQHNASITSVNAKKRWLSFSPLKDVRFLLLLGSATLVEFSLMTPFTFLPDMMSEAGYKKKDAVFMLFLIGLLSTIARIISGLVADLRFVNRVKLCYSLIVLNGVVVALCPLCFNYASYVAFAAIFGFASGSSAVFRSVLLPDLFGVEMIADRLGILNFFNGCSALIGLPITGAIYDVSGSYVIPFIVAGIEMAVSGLFVVMITILRKQKTHEART